MPASNQGTVVVAGKNTAPLIRQTSNNSTLSLKLKGSLFLPPLEISRMMTSSTNWKKPYLDQLHAEHSDILPLTGMMKDNNQLVVTKLSENKHMSRQLRALILFTPQDALAHIRSKLATIASITVDDLFEVTLSDLSNEFKKFLDIFYLDGIVMTETENVKHLNYLMNGKKTRILILKYVSMAM